MRKKEKLHHKEIPMLTRLVFVVLIVISLCVAGTIGAMAGIISGASINSDFVGGAVGLSLFALSMWWLTMVSNWVCFNKKVL